MTTHKHEIEESVDVPPEAVAAVKLTRADAVKLVAADMIVQCADDVERCEARVIEARDLFRQDVIRSAMSVHGLTLSSMLKAVGKDASSLNTTCTYRMYENGDDSGDTAQVVFADHQMSYEARASLRVDVPLSPRAKELAKHWLHALWALKAARSRDLRVGAMKKEARDLLIKSALAESEEGANVVEAVKALAKVLKEKA
jgi:hypothetical protein